MGAKITFRYQSKAGATFNVKPAMVGDIEALIDQVRTEIDKNKSKGKFICYLSVPISPRGGGDFETNMTMASHIADRVRRKFGKHLWILNPAAYDLPKEASGGDYMAVWADVLAGSDGRGEGFDMVYFVGPNDVWDFFGATRANRLGRVEQWLIKKAGGDSRYKEILDDNELRRNFIRYYGIRGSTAYSKGAHDEWNIVSRLNLERAIGDDIAVYFDGQPIEPGDYDDTTDAGYQAHILP